MLSNDESPILDMVFAALSNEKRREIMRTLSFHPATVGQLAEEHKISLPSIHRHIRTLEEAQLIQRRKIGRTNFVAIRRRSMIVARQWMAQYHLEYGNDDETLENYVTYLTENTNHKGV